MQSACASIMAWAAVLGAGAPQPAVEESIRDLRSGSPAVRAQAAVTLGRLGRVQATPALAEALKDSDKAVRREAAKALGFLKDPGAVSALVAALKDSDANVRAYAAYALGEIKDAKAAAALLDALGDRQWCVRDQAAWALREISDPAAVDPLLARLRSEDADLDQTIWILKRTDRKRVLGRIRAMLRAPEVRLRRRAVDALARFRDKASVEPLAAALEDSDLQTRRMALGALVAIGDKRACKPIRALAARETDPGLREAAQKAYSELSRDKRLVAYWSFDDKNTKVAKDMTGRGIDGQVKGCTVVKGKVGAALLFGKGKFVELGQPAGLPIGGKALTFAAWVKTDAKNGVVVARGGAWCGFSLYIKDGVAKFGIHRVREDPAYIAAGTASVVGDWVHLAGVIKKDRVEVYVNGKLAGTAKSKGYIPGNCGQGMEIGFDTANSPAEITDAFEGVIDEVKVFHAALTAAEIAKLMRSADEE